MSHVEKIAAIVNDVNPSITVAPAQYDEALLDIGLDSLDHASVLLQVEEVYDIKIPDDQAEQLMTVSSIASFVAEQLGS